jgi:hypothetical protein
VCVSVLQVLLLAAAERGVRVFALIFREMAIAMPNNSLYAARTLLALHDNIKVRRRG